ncbi:LuxR C-terminal-related transcriptional regulator [Chishuiella sp.]|uniref:LuxR C-terminal-related transcriptional regulator n=1 Tax=Chishuiella sp. TaxID=1969467 RepID=UPI0028B1DC8C|nr:LuxR C-terminal-related transcriptional regulator [Chishuiella sp.]
MDENTLRIYTEKVKESWKKNTDKSNLSFLEAQIEKLREYKNILDTFTIGGYFIYVINPQSGHFEYVSEQCEKILGYSASEYTAELCVKIIHPEDLDHVIAIQQKISNFSEHIEDKKRKNYKFNYDFRVYDSEKKLHQIHLQHFFLELGDNSLPSSVFCLATDITQIKMGGIPQLNIFHLNQNLTDILNSNKNNLILTSKEKEIVNFLIKGYTSKDIASAMDLSKHTIDTHRRNILKKNNCANTTELFSLIL